MGDSRLLILLLVLAVVPSTCLRSQNFKIIYEFNNSTNGAYPQSSVVLINNTLYGTTSDGGANFNGGTVYTVNTDGTGFQVLCNFAGDERNPSGAFVISDGILYTTGTQPNGSTGPGGSLMEVALDGSSQSLPVSWYDFEPVVGDGIGPDGVIMSGGILYGVTTSGGKFGYGTVYAYDGWIVTNLYSFARNDGANPAGSLVLFNGTFYGVTSSGGTWGQGTVFSINADSSGFQTLHHFSGSTNGEGANPLGGLILWGNTLFGTTSSGGAFSDGTVFSVSTNGMGFTTLYNFSGGLDGSKPVAALNLSGKTLFGTTKRGGAGGWGTIFALGTDGSSFTTLHGFNAVDGAYPVAKMLLFNNTLFGTTSGNDFTNYGTVFSLSLGVAPPKPLQLTITPAGSTVLLSWPTNGNFFLQSASNLVPLSNWTKVSAVPVVLNGLNTVTDTIFRPFEFYRLSQ